MLLVQHTAEATVAGMWGEPTLKKKQASHLVDLCHEFFDLNCDRHDFGEVIRCGCMNI